MIKAQGFSLVEIIIVIAIIAVLGSLAIIAFNPQDYFSNSRNSVRVNDVRVIGEAIRNWMLREGVNDPDPHSTIGATGGGVSAISPNDGEIAGEGIDADDIAIPGAEFTYLDEIPIDPDGSTQYRVGVDDVSNPGVVYVCSDQIEPTDQYNSTDYPNGIYCVGI